LLLKLAQRIENLLVQAREDGFGLLDGLFLSSKYQYVMGTPCRFPATEKRNRNCLIGDFTNLLSQNELGILVIGVFASFEFGDLDVLLLEFLVVALFFFDQAVDRMIFGDRVYGLMFQKSLRVVRVSYLFS